MTARGGTAQSVGETAMAKASFIVIVRRKKAKAGSDRSINNEAWGPFNSREKAATFGRVFFYGLSWSTCELTEVLPEMEARARNHPRNAHVFAEDTYANYGAAE
jgi:hypothetical protein